jgi:hypothetical protein
MPAMFSTLMIAALSVFGVMDSPIVLSPADTWEFTVSEQYEAWVDQRDLLVLYHPWEESVAGGAAMAAREIPAPKDWDGPLRLHFYMTDDYDGQAELMKEDWRGSIRLPDRRFKQVLVNDAVVWERDVADAEGTAQPARFSVLLPESSGSLRVAFRLVDKRGSKEIGGDAKRSIGTTDSIKDDEPWRFMTHLYVGDVALSPADVESIPNGESPARQAVQERSLPLPMGRPVDFPVRLKVQGGTSDGFLRPLHCGVPLPRGQFKNVDALRLKNADGQALPFRAAPLNFWDDGSVRWVEIDSVLSGSDGHVLLDTGNTPAPRSPHSVHALRLPDGRLALDNGLIRVETSHDPTLLLAQCIRQDMVLRRLRPALEMDNQACIPKLESLRIRDENPLHATLELRGTLQAGAEKIGDYVFTVAAFANSPYLRMTWRVFATQPGQTQFTAMALTAETTFPSAPTASWADDKQSDAKGVRVHQRSENLFSVVNGKEIILDSGNRSSGWLGLQQGNQALGVLIRHFAQQHPLALQHEAGLLRMELFAATTETPLHAPHEGEAKRHEIWLGLWDQPMTAPDFSAVAAYFVDPPHLFNADYFCATGAQGRAFPHDNLRFPRLTAFMDTTYDALPESAFYSTGIRHWGDQIYNADKQHWRNGYYDRPQGFAAEYLMTGDYRWFRRLEAAAQHAIDIDICHASAEHPNWVGGIHAYYGADHSTEAPWNPCQRIKGLLAYGRITADRVLLEEAVNVGRSAAKFKRAIGATSVRDHAGVLDSLVAAYDESRDPALLEAAGQLAHDAMKRIDPRRGTYPEIHGNVSYRGNVPWMVVQLAEPLFEYYIESGDLDAARAVVGLAESILAENTTRGVDGDVFGYSHNPHFKKTSNYHILIAPILFYAHELTGDEGFARHARAMYKQTLAKNTVNPIGNCYWETPTLLYYLNRNKK